MKKFTLISVIAVSILLVGCGDDSKKAAAEATSKAVESTKEAAGTVAEAAKKAADITVEKAKEAEVAAEEAAKEAVTATKEAVATATKVAKETINETVVDKVSNTKGKEIYAKCSGCHGLDGMTKALGKSPTIAGGDKNDILAKLQEYKAGTRNANGMGTLMKGQVSSIDEAGLIAVAEYISTLK